MSVFAAVMTGSGAGAIATVQIVGDEAESTLQKVFRRARAKSLSLPAGRVLVGHIVDGDDTVDQVTLACEDVGRYAIHCHGNPLIVQRIVSLLQHHGAAILPAEQLLARALTRDQFHSTIEMESQLALATVKTMEGAELIANQVSAGLLQKVRQWRDSLNSISLRQIAAEAEQILTDSEPARLIISGCTIALVGPPNTGKSTLLNALAGREKAIVTDIPGTTRDWVSAEIHIPPLAATIIDTAGLNAMLAAESGDIEMAAQQRSMEVLDRADLVLLVLDITQSAGQVPASLTKAFSARNTLVVLNKADLPPSGGIAPTPPAVRISARYGTGIDGLIATIHSICGVTGFSRNCAVVFTDRQRRLLADLPPARSTSEVASLISELLEGPLSV